MLKTFLVLLPLLGIAILLMAVQIIFKKNGKFHAEDVGQSKAMRDRGIHCVRTQDRIAYHDKKTINDMMK